MLGQSCGRERHFSLEPETLVSYGIQRVKKCCSIIVFWGLKTDRSKSTSKIMEKWLLILRTKKQILDVIIPPSPFSCYANRHSQSHRALPTFHTLQALLLLSILVLWLCTITLCQIYASSCPSSSSFLWPVLLYAALEDCCILLSFVSSLTFFSFCISNCKLLLQIFLTCCRWYQKLFLITKFWTKPGVLSWLKRKEFLETQRSH